MTIKNKYVNRSKISEAKTRQILKLFSLDLDASQITVITGLNRNTVNRYLAEIRLRISEYCLTQAPVPQWTETGGEFSGNGRDEGKIYPGIQGKPLVIGIFRRNGKIYTEIVPECCRIASQAVARGHASPDSVIYMRGWRGYDSLVDLGFKKLVQVRYRENEQVTCVRTHFNGIETFWGYAKTRLVRFRGIPPKTFCLHLKECEFRFNERDENLYLLLLKILRDKPLF